MAKRNKTHTESEKSSANVNRTKKLKGPKGPGSEETVAVVNAAVEPLQSVLMACSMNPRAMTAAQLCDLVTKYKAYPHRLPLLALASTARTALFNETLYDFCCELEEAIQIHSERRRKEAAQCEEKCAALSQSQAQLETEASIAMRKDDTKLSQILQSDPVPSNLNLNLLRRLLDDLVFLDKFVQGVCKGDKRREENGGKCIPITEVALLGKPLVEEYKKKRNYKKNLLGKAFPLIEAMRIHPGIDGRTFTYSAQERACGYEALGALQKLVDTFPYIQAYLDPPHVIAQCTTGAVPPNLDQCLPQGRMTPNPVDIADGNSLNGLLTLQGDERDARWAGDTLRMHYRDVAGANGGPAPLPIGNPSNVRILSFSTNAGGNIVYH